MGEWHKCALFHGRSYLLEPNLKATLVNPYYSANNSVLSISADVFVMVSPM